VALAHEPFEFRLTSAELTPGAFVVTISGELDLTNARRIDEELASLSEDSAQHLVIDLLEVPFLESTVLGVVLSHAQRLRANGGDMTIVTDDVRVLRVFEITGLESHFRFERSLSSAIENILTAAVN
jgi:anti-sigma B factor antagonist